MKNLFFLLVALVASVCALAQDVIVTKDEKKIEAKITEVSKSEIKYKEFDYQDGPTFILSTDEIATITYGNGKVVVYNQPLSEEDLTRERAKREEGARQQAELEQGDIDALGQVREEEERTRQAEAVAKANAMGSLFGQSGNASGDGRKGHPIGHGCTGGNTYTLSGRNLVGELPSPARNFKQEGVIVVEIRVDEYGNVVQAKYKGGDVTDRQTIQLALDAAKKAKFTEGDSDVIGTITYIFKLN